MGRRQHQPLGQRQPPAARIVPRNGIDEVARQATHVHHKRVLPAVAQTAYIRAVHTPAVVDHALGGPDVQAAVAGVVHDQRPGVDRSRKLRRQVGHRKALVLILLQVEPLRRCHARGQKGGHILVHGLEDRLPLLGLVVGRKHQALLPALGVGARLVGDNLCDHVRGLGGAVRRKPADVQIRHRIRTAHLHVPVVADRLPQVRGVDQIPRHIVDCPKVAVVLVVVGGVPHQQHVLRGGALPVLVGVGDKILDRLRSRKPVAELIEDVGHIHHRRAQPLGLTQPDEACNPALLSPAALPADLPVRDQDPVRGVRCTGKV